MASINTNLMSLNAARNLSTSQNAMSIAVQRLSSGLRVNSAKDDAAGLAIAERMNAQARGMNVAIRNANDAISLAQTAEGALSRIGEALQRMRELAVQSANGTNQSTDRDNLQKEFAELQSEVKRLISQTKFNSTQVLKGGTQTFQVGANTGETISLNGTDLTATTAKVQAAAATTVSITGADATNSNAAITALDDALTEINTERSLYGAAQSRFESAISSLQVGVENQAAARSRIMDADYAQETAALTRAQILQQAGVAMLAQANAMPQNVLSLLRG